MSLRSRFLALHMPRSMRYYMPPHADLATPLPTLQDYMSPQITAAKAQGKALYDGTKADVWAMGVLLCVMLIGKFPFEGDSVSTMGVNDPMKKVGVAHFVLGRRVHAGQRLQ